VDRKTADQTGPSGEGGSGLRYVELETVEVAKLPLERRHGDPENR
jgi:hypothetical protein